LCAAAPSSAAFTAGRAIAGLGAAGLFQGALVIITQTFPLQKRPMYIGIVLSSTGICIRIGPVLGGVFASRATWRWCFWM
jgi:MFS family permease